MADETGPIAPAWTVKGTLASGALALVLHVAGGWQLSRIPTAITLGGVTYLLYEWGQCREPPYKNGEGKSRREKEMEAEAGGYGGNM